MDTDRFGLLAEFAVRGSFDSEYYAENVIRLLRDVWADIPEHRQRRILVDIEVETMPHRRKPPALRDEWLKFLADLTPPKAPFTVDYRCGKCGANEVKLWRGTHGCADAEGLTLKCAACLAPDLTVDAEGRAPNPLLGGGTTDQIAGWLPAVPVGDTFWGYSSVPTADVNWWRALRTYPTDAVPA